MPLNIKEELVTVDSSQSDTKLDDSSAINDGNFSEISDDVDDDILNRDVSLLSLFFFEFCVSKKSLNHSFKVVKN